ncbi:Putative aliphatic sulfonates transport permease protein SsuC [Stieleria maiorica]|uniref:Aliphatic sulfonates transport permease protein SsuC n=1 Tax=Stieleria maiorica TaxID=2795974 RepID=A0A5B9MJG8_9BACT|nr:ABC transporter permease subunit [Stieleria maiorica]QEG01014.1 Putative aliphatic sulfonates transport permease protein SsuC [Stieleria maiorica]
MSGPHSRSLAIRASDAARHWGPAVIVALVALATWHLIAWGFKMPSALLPKPAEVWKAAMEHRIELLKALYATGLAAAAGLLAAIGLGSMISVGFSQSRRVRLAFFPYVIFLQTVPIVAIAPLLIIWSGYQFRTVVIVTVIVCLFPIVNSVTAGLMAIDRQWSDLFALYGAGRSQKLARLQIPAAVPYLILGAKTSSGLAVIGAIVAEFFVGNGTDYDGLGTLMTHWQGFVKTDALIAAVFTSTLLGLFLFGLVHLVSRTLLRRWIDVG